jgi:putative ubiquitin-RnfH superfamily antitoxin RatB of RatAB toxin-antitoxin module
MVSKTEISVTVVYSSTARHVQEVKLDVAPHSTALNAIEISGLLELFPEIDLQTAAVGVWGRRAAVTQSLRENDRVEIYRQLTVDPKVARRTRFKKQGVRTTGLFAQNRANGRTDF